MDTSMLAMAWVTALSHLALIIVLVVGGPLGVRRPRVRRLHVGLAIPTALVFLVGAACPLTVTEKWFLTEAGRSTYSGGFIDHYLVQPVYEPGITPLIAILIPVVWLIPTIAAYARSSTRPGAEVSPSGS